MFRFVITAVGNISTTIVFKISVEDRGEINQGNKIPQIYIKTKGFITNLQLFSTLQTRKRYLAGNSVRDDRLAKRKEQSKRFLTLSLRSLLNFYGALTLNC